MIGDYQDDFQGGTFPDGWQYLWNAPSGYNPGVASGDGTTNPVGTAASYTNLIFNGTNWTPDGDTTNGNNQPAAFSRLSPDGGHPALGSAQGGGVGNTLDRAVVAAFTVEKSGITYITNSNISDGGTGPTGINVMVHVNDNAPALNTTFADGFSNQSFNASLGTLNAGDTVYVAFGPDGNAGTDGFTMDFTVEQFESATTVANYRNDFQGGSFPDGWQYLWNAPDGYDPGNSAGDGTTNPIGDPNNYAALIFNGTNYTPDGDTTNGNNQPAAFSNMGALGGHPALGDTQAGGVGNTEDRYVIAAFTVEEDGFYDVVNGFIDPLTTAGNGSNLLIHVNGDAPLVDLLFDDDAISFDLILGELQAGDTIYFAVGPNGNAGNDSFEWNFDIRRLNSAVPEPTTASLALLGVLGFLRRRRQAA